MSEHRECDARAAVLRKEIAAQIRLEGGELPSEEREDVVQTVCARLEEQFPDPWYENRQMSRHSWLLQVIRHEIANIFRARNRHPTRPLLDSDEEWMEAREQDTADRERFEARSALLRRWLEDFRQTNPVAFDLFWARYIDRVRIAELAKRTGKDAKWISNCLRAAKERFKRWLKKHGYDRREWP